MPKKIFFNTNTEKIIIRKFFNILFSSEKLKMMFINGLNLSSIISGLIIYDTKIGIEPRLINSIDDVTRFPKKINKIINFCLLVNKRLILDII